MGDTILFVGGGNVKNPPIDPRVNNKPSKGKQQKVLPPIVVLPVSAFFVPKDVLCIPVRPARNKLKEAIF